MQDIVYAPLTGESFTRLSLDHFVRHQQVTACWRWEGKKLVLRPVAFVEDWSLEDRRRRAERILRDLQEGGAAFGALVAGNVVGYALLSGATGSGKQLMKLDSFHVSAPYRRLGIGRRLFDMACGEARRRGYSGLYISACSAMETQAAYRAYGCVPAPEEEIDPESAAEEPCDIQMVRWLEK